MPDASEYLSMTRHNLKLTALCCATMFGVVASPLHAADAKPGGAKKSDIAAQPNQVRGDEITPAQQEAVRRGLAWLAAHQQADGSYGAGGGAGKHAGITALAGLAFMQAGN